MIMGYLDSAGLSSFWNKLKTILSGKQNSLSAGRGIDLTDSTVSVTTPVRGLTKAEYDALSTEDKNSGLYILTDSNISPDILGNIYSTVETRIGTWIDEKPLYRRVFQFSCPSGSSIISNTAILDLDQMVRCSGVIAGDSNANTNDLYPFPYYNSGKYIFLSYSKNESGIRVNNADHLFTAGCAITAIIDYTKTTDMVTLNTMSLGLPVETSEGPSEECAESIKVIKTASSVVSSSASSAAASKIATASASSARFRFVNASTSSARFRFVNASASSSKARL